MVEVTVRGRLAFGNDLWTAKAPQDGNGEAKFGCTIIIDPKSKKDLGPEAVKAIDAAIQAVAKDKWKAKAPNILRVIENDAQKWTWFKKDRINGEGEPVDGFEGMYYLQCKSPVQPTIIDRDRTPLKKADGRPYSGCFCVFKVDIWPQDNANGKGMRAQIKGVQFLRDGDAFGGGKRSNVEDFEDLSDLGDDDDAGDDDAAAAKAKAKAKAAKARAAAAAEDDDDDIA